MFNFKTNKSSAAGTNLKSICKMNWGAVTPEFSNNKTNTFIHIFNHDLSTEQGVEISIKFAVGRINWYNHYLGLSLIHEVIFDDVGQGISDKTRKYIAKKLRPYSSKVIFESKRG